MGAAYTERKNIMELSNEEKRALKKAYLARMNRKYILKKKEAKNMFEYIDKKVCEQGCDYSLRFCREWIDKHILDEDRKRQVLEEIQDMGGYCDCEVILNCYERYELA